MELSHQEIQALKGEIIKECKNLFVLIDDCNDIQSDTNKKFANDDKRIDRLMERMSVWNKLLWTIASASIGALVVSFLELILK